MTKSEARRATSLDARAQTSAGSRQPKRPVESALRSQRPIITRNSFGSYFNIATPGGSIASTSSSDSGHPSCSLGMRFRHPAVSVQHVLRLQRRRHSFGFRQTEAKVMAETRCRIEKISICVRVSFANAEKPPLPGHLE